MDGDIGRKQPRCGFDCIMVDGVAQADGSLSRAEETLTLTAGTWPLEAGVAARRRLWTLGRLSEQRLGCGGGGDDHIESHWGGDLRSVAASRRR